MHIATVVFFLVRPNPGEKSDPPARGFWHFDADDGMIAAIDLKPNSSKRSSLPLQIIPRFHGSATNVTR